MNRALNILLALSALYLIFPQKAQAYIDPSTGSYMTQLIVGCIFALILSTKTIWGKIRRQIAKFRK